MALTLRLREDAGILVATFGDQTVRTELVKLPAIDRLQADPFTHGQVLTAALGGREMLCGSLPVTLTIYFCSIAMMPPTLWLGNLPPCQSVSFCASKRGCCGRCSLSRPPRT